MRSQALRFQDPRGGLDELGGPRQQARFEGGVRGAHEGGAAQDLLCAFAKKGWVLQKRHVPVSEDALRSCDRRVILPPHLRDRPCTRDADMDRHVPVKVV